MKKVCHIVFSPDCYKLVLLVVSLVGVCPFLEGPIIPYLKLLHLYTAAVIVFDLLGEKRILRNKGRVMLAAFVLCYGVTLLCNNELLNFSGISNFAYLFACLALVYSYGGNSEKWDRVTTDVVLILVSLANLAGIWMFFAKYKLAFVYGYIGMYPSQNRLAGLFGNPNVLGTICMGAVCLAVIRLVKSRGRPAKGLYTAVIVINYITLLLANSRTQIYALCILCALFVFLYVVRKGYSGKRVVLAVVSAVVVLVFAYGAGQLLQMGLSALGKLLNDVGSFGNAIKRAADESALNGRVKIWLHALKVFWDRPLFGCGKDNISATLVAIGEKPLWVGGSLHNTYLEILVSSGVAGFLCFAAFLCVVLRNTVSFFRGKAKETYLQGAAMLVCVVAFLVDALADSSLMFSAHPSSTLFCFIMSQYMGLLETENRKTGDYFPGPFVLLEEKRKDRKRPKGKRVCFVNDSLGGGGAEQVLVNAANAMNANGYDVTVLTLWSGGVLEGRLSDEVTLRTMDPFNLLFFKRVQHWVNRHCMPRRLYNFLWLDGRYDYTVAFLEGLSTRLVADTKLRPGGKRYAWVHIDMKQQNWVLPYYKSEEEEKESYRVFDRIFCVSESARKAFVEVIGCEDKSKTLYNLMDTDRIVALGQKACPEIRPNGLLLYTVGRLNDQKGFDRLISVVGRLRGKGLNVSAWILGEGNKRPALEQQIRESGLEDFVRLLGFQENPYCFAAQADVFVSSSRAEGYSTVITENLLLGKPIVATLCAGVREQLGDSEYGIVTENDEDALYDGLYRMATDASMREHYAEKALERSRSMSYDVRLKELLENF